MHVPEGEDVFVEFVRQNFDETIEVGAHHAQIEVDIPRNETFVPCRAQKCAVARPISYFVLATDAVEFRPHLKLTVPNFFVVRHDKPT